MKVKIKTIRQMLDTGAEEKKGIVRHTNHLWPFTDPFDAMLPADRVVDVMLDTLPGHYVWNRSPRVKFIIQDWMIAEKFDEAKQDERNPEDELAESIANCPHCPL